MENLEEEVLNELLEVEKEIQEPEIIAPENQVRFSSASWYKFTKDIEVLIGGAGGIGSYVTYFLNRSNISTMVFDFDTIEEVNFAGQFLSYNVLGKPKVEGLKTLVSMFTKKDITTFNEKYTKDSLIHPYMISGFDNMEARKVMFDNWVKLVEEWEGLDDEDEDKLMYPVPLFIDGRLSPESFQIYCVTPDRIEEYRKTLFDDSEVEEPICSYKQTSHIAGMIGSFITTFFLNHLTNVGTGIEMNDVPFYTSYMAGINILERNDKFE